VPPPPHKGITALEEIRGPATTEGNPARQEFTLLQTLCGFKKNKPKFSIELPLPPLQPLVQKM